MSSLIPELEKAVQQLLQHNVQLKQQLSQLTEQHELLQLELMEKEEQQNADTERLQALLAVVNNGQA